ncbi:uncharacterized protein LOC125315975 [Rhodamnia argentea]|uniref:Uncharacterized protein LOC125315975 n=1 Tax=Rhodamnia argentea TaxID=178133 RepID=A0ABM3HPN8_9MYRT|nr:uncharacterized protein LOC125315975 [Rhodamnia argentea]
MEFIWMIPLTELHDHTKGYLVNDRLVINVEVCVLRFNPAVNTRSAGLINNFGAYFVSLNERIEEAETNGVRVGSSSRSRDVAVTSETLSLEEVEEAKQSLKGCLWDLFKLNMKERLSMALSTLRSARAGLSAKHCEAIQKFLANYDEFTSDYLIFEQDNAEFELHKIQMDRMFLEMKEVREIHTFYKQLMEDITKEERELNGKMQKVQCRKDKLLSDWEILLVKLEEANSGYTEEKKKAAEAEEKKRIAEERMSRSATAWSDLKVLFC